MTRLSRRAFMLGAGATGLGLLAGCGRLPGQVQPSAKVPRIGYLAFASPEEYAAESHTLREALKEYGYVEGQNLVIENRSADARIERLPALAADLALGNVDVILAYNSSATRAAKQATATIPIVMMAYGDPIGQGLVTSLARPGGNVTGLSQMSTELSAKRLELLKDTLPGLTRVGVLWAADNPGSALGWREMQVAAPALGVELQSLEVRGPDDLEPAFDAANRGRAEAIMSVAVIPRIRRSRFAALAAQNRLPSMAESPEDVVAGCLMAYGTRWTALHHRAAYYVDRILKGAKPADLPVEQPMTFDFAVNLKAAREFGITFPNEIMLQVTEVIE